MAQTVQRIDRVLGWTAAGGVLLLLACLCLRRVWCVDFWWQWATGRLVIESGIPRADVFSFTAAGNRWLEMRWIYCCLLFLLTEKVGLWAAVVAKWLVITATFLAAAFAVRPRRGIIGACAVTFIAVLASSERFLIRPELVTYLLVAAYLWIIVRYRATGGRWIYTLPAWQILWTNLHTLFILGPVIVGAFWAASVVETLAAKEAERELKRRQLTVASIVLAATVLACLVNPYGVEGLLFPFQLFREIRGGVFKQYISEFQSPFVAGELRPALLFYFTLILLVAGSCAINLRRLDPFLALFCCSQLYLSATSIRNIPLFAVSAVPLVIWNLDHAAILKGGAAQRALPWLRRATAVVLTVVSVGLARDLLTDRYHVRQHDTNQAGLGLARHRFPVEAVGFMREHGIEGPVFALFHEGAYLLSAGYPVFIDPRLEIYGEAFVARYVQMQRDESAWRTAADEYGFSAALIDPESRIVSFLAADPEWALVYFDANAALYLRGEQAAAVPALRTEADVETVLAGVRASLPALAPAGELGFFQRAQSPAPWLRLGRFLAAEGHTALAAGLLRTVAENAPECPGALSSYAIVLDRRGDGSGAVAWYEQALTREPGNAGIRLRLGQHYLETGSPRRAVRVLIEATEADPDTATGWALLGKAHLAQENTDAALEAMTRAMALEPDNPTYLRNVAKLEMVQGRHAPAARHIEQLIELDQADAPIYAMLAGIHALRGSVADARAAVQRGLARFPGNEELLDLQRRMDEARPDE